MTLFYDTDYIDLSPSQLLKSKLDVLSLEHSLSCDKIEMLQTELATLKKEHGNLSCRIKEQEQASTLSNDLQVSSMFPIVCNV